MADRNRPVTSVYRRGGGTVMLLGKYMHSNFP
jgi:hypothetical protein